MYEAFGFYRAEWFLRFMGIISGSGNRFVVYTNSLPENVCRAVRELAVLVLRARAAKLTVYEGAVYELAVYPVRVV